MAASDPPPLPTLSLGVEGWVLRAWREGDAPSLCRHANDTEVWRWMSDGFPHPYTLAIAEHWVTRGHVDFGGDHWAIACQDEAVGGCGIQQGHAQFMCNAEVGWWLARPLWGRGIASRAARALVTRGFENPQITRLFAPVHDGNTRSMRVALNAGFTLEGIQRRSAMKAGRLVDRHIYALVRDA